MCVGLPSDKTAEYNKNERYSVRRRKLIPIYFSIRTIYIKNKNERYSVRRRKLYYDPEHKITIPL